MSLARFARECLRATLGGPQVAAPTDVRATELAATFVSLHWPDGRLQGCIGSIEPRRPLAEDVAANALADVDRLDVEVSILSPLEAIACASEVEARTALRPFADGVVLRWRARRATFLPQVWRHLPDPESFLAELKLKAGLPADHWDADVELFRYRVDIDHDPPR